MLYALDTTWPYILGLLCNSSPQVLQLYCNGALATAAQAECLLPVFATILSLSPQEVQRCVIALF